MGNWTITVHGTGPHHNPNHPGDADKMARAFTQSLRDAGHSITEAEFTSGSRESLLVMGPKGPIEQRLAAAEIPGAHQGYGNKPRRYIDPGDPGAADQSDSGRENFR